MQIWNVLILLLDHNTSWHKHVMKKTCLVRPDWLLVRSKLVSGLTIDLLTFKNYLQPGVYLNSRLHVPHFEILHLVELCLYVTGSYI